MHLSLLVFSDVMLNNNVMKPILFLPMFCQITNVLSFQKKVKKNCFLKLCQLVCCSLLGLIGFSFNCN